MGKRRSTRNKCIPEVWYCCNCGDGPLGYHTSPACTNSLCPDRFHWRCDQCIIHDSNGRQVILAESERFLNNKNANDSRRVPPLPTSPPTTKPPPTVSGGATRATTLPGHSSDSHAPTIKPPPTVSGGATTTLPDSGYGSASYALTTNDAGPDDTASVNTDSLSLELPEDRVEVYVKAFAKHLCDDTDVKTPNPQLIACLPDLLRIFALRMTTEGDSIESRTAGLFVRQNKIRISKAFLAGVAVKSQDPDAPEPAESSNADGSFASGSSRPIAPWVGIPGVPVKDLVSHWLVDMQEVPLDNPDLDDLDAVQERKDMDERIDLSEMDMSRINHVLTTTSYTWLKSAVQSRALLDYTRASTLISLRRTLASVFTRPRGNRALQKHSVVVKMSWDPCHFIQEQGYGGSDCLLTALTLTCTDDETNTQLLSCIQYVRQTWPLIGEAVVSGLLEAITSARTISDPKARSRVIHKTLFDGTEIGIQVAEEGLLKVTCAGLFDSLSETTEVLAWLGAALRESSHPEMISHSLAKFSLAGKEKIEQEPLCLKLDFGEAEEELLVGELDKLTINEGGCCWKRLFKNPVVAKGFPIPMRPDGLAGLEISLDAMALLVNAPRLTVLNHRAVLKGHNAATVLTDRSRGSVMRWHVICNEDGSRLPFSDPRIRTSFPMNEEGRDDLERIQDARHILGWSPSVWYNIGSPLANYDIGWSSPGFAGPGCALEKIIISGGPGFLTASAELSLGRKDKSPRIKREMPGHFDSLGMLSTSFVVFYDIRDHRAWLSNGLHALLHLVRASLKHDQKGELAAECLFRASDLREDADPSNPHAAANFLRNQENLELPIFRGSDEVRVEVATSGGVATKTEYRSTSRVLLMDRINYLASVLEELIGHQASVNGFAGGVALKLPREKLEGFRFMDIAARRVGTPRVVRLDALGGSAGKTWIDFIHSIKAVTLFGEGFGELMEPAPNSSNVCPEWRTLPKKRDHLAVSSFDLSKILRQEGDAEACPPKLAPGVFWQPTTALFEPCVCQDRKRKSCDPVQALLSESWFKRAAKKSSPTMKLYDMIGETSAIVFGRSSILSYLRRPGRSEP